MSVNPSVIGPCVEYDAALQVCLNLQPFNHSGHASRAVVPFDQAAMTFDDMGNMFEELSQSIREKKTILALIAASASIEICAGTCSHPLTDISTIDVQADLRTIDQGEELEEACDSTTITFFDSLVKLS